jgi:Tripartite tricarboxylate transporter family receptor
MFGDQALDALAYFGIQRRRILSRRSKGGFTMKGICFWLLTLIFSTCPVAAQTPYYQGKTIRIIVGYPAGSVHDTWGRLVAPQLTKYIPGNPATVVENRTGAGSMVAANYVYNVARPDGLTIGVVNAALYFDQLMKRPEVQFDWSKYSWVGSSTRPMLSFTCGPMPPTKPFTTSAALPYRQNAAPPELAILDTISRSCWSKRLEQNFNS